MATNSSTARVRSADPPIADLIPNASAKSRTIRQLMAILERSDVIVYVEKKTMRLHHRAYLLHQVIARGGYRYPRVAFEMHRTQRQSFALLAHELQHAIEVAQSTEVCDAEAVKSLFRRRSYEFGCGGAECDETAAAERIEQLVSQEIAVIDEAN